MDAMEQRVSLPKSVRPRRYTLTLRPDLKTFTFTGRVEAEIDILERTSSITCNAVDLHIKRASLKLPGHSSQLQVTSITTNKEDETITYNFFPRILPVGKAWLRVLFTGELNDQMHGFYRSKYMVGGETRYMAVTQFEATDARRAFPCWDEPALKATFKVILKVPKDRVALSNMPIERELVDKDGLKILYFKATPVMSTYLLAFIVGEFDSVGCLTKNNVLVTVFKPVGKKEQGLFALDVATKILTFYEDYFGIPYPLPKLDLVAIPDFAAGAMENWGLVTYRETAILYDKEHSSHQTKQRIAIVIAHELAHQWFGNLVTMEWWDHLWLNEGFASWIEYLAVDHLFPEWDIWTQFVAVDFTHALDLDSLENSHPIEVKVKNPNEINEIFDAVSYSKGASIIRMLREYLGDEVFRTGLKYYLTRHQYGNATTEDLWVSLEKASGKPIKVVMDTWTKQAGYPLISLFERVTSFSHNDYSRFTAIQSPFLKRIGRVKKERGQEWKIPLAMVNMHVTEPTFTMFGGHSTLVDLPPKGWVKINPGQNGFYRVNYTPEFWRRLIPAIQSRELGPRDRLGIQNDAFALAQSGILPTTQFLDLLDAYKDDTNYSVWADVASNLKKLDALLADTPFYQKFRDFVRELFWPITERLGWDPPHEKRHLDALLQALAVLMSGTFGNSSIIKEASQRFSTWVSSKDASVLPAHLRSAVYSTVMGQLTPEQDRESYDQLLKIFRESDLHEEKVRCLRAFGHTPNGELLGRTLEFALSEEVRAQDLCEVVGSVANNYRHGRELAWQFVKENWERLYKRYGGNKHLLPDLISTTTSNFVTREKAAEIEEFFAQNLVPAAARTVKQSIEFTHSNAEWIVRDGKIIEKWFREHFA